MAAPSKVFLTPAERDAGLDKHKAGVLGARDEKVRIRFIAKRNDVTTIAPLGSKDLEFYTLEAPSQLVRELKESGWVSEITSYLHEHDKKCKSEKGVLMCERFVESSGIYGDDAVPFWTLSTPQPFVAAVPKPIIERTAPIVEGNGGPDIATDAKDAK